MHGYRAINVDAQRRNPSSLLHWTRWMIHLRRQIPAFGLGDYQELHGSNLAVLAYARRYLSNVVICVNNLSRTRRQPNSTSHPGQDTTSPSSPETRPFPPSTTCHTITLGPHGFYWLELRLPT